MRGRELIAQLDHSEHLRRDGRPFCHRRIHAVQVARPEGGQGGSPTALVDLLHRRRPAADQGRRAQSRPVRIEQCCAHADIGQDPLSALGTPSADSGRSGLIAQGLDIAADEPYVNGQFVRRPLVAALMLRSRISSRPCSGPRRTGSSSRSISTASR